MNKSNLEKLLLRIEKQLDFIEKVSAENRETFLMKKEKFPNDEYWHYYEGKSKAFEMSAKWIREIIQETKEE